MDIARDTKNAQLDYPSGKAAPVRAGAPGSTIHEHEIPDFVAHELERLYESVYCTMARFRVYGEAEGASTYVARDGQAITCVILFRIEGRVVKVINQQVALSAADLRGFARAVFARYRKARLISFYAIDSRLEQFPYPYESCEALEENVVRLPAQPQDYDDSLSQNLLKRLQSAERKLKRDFPDFRFQVLKGTEVSEHLLRTITGLAGARMAAKQQEAYIHDADIGNILRVIHAYGYAGVLTVDGVVRGGNVFYGVGQRYFMHIIAHDPDYDKYMLGHMVQYLAARHCITLGGRECCLMGGGRENKSRFGARTMYLSSVDIYRSRWQRMLSARRVWAAGIRHRMHQARHDLSRLAQADNGVGKAVARGLALLRAVRHPRKQHKDAAK
jgi:hypothetical protein